MSVTTADVVKLRHATGAGMMDCKNALVEAEGNFDRAVEIIRERGKLVASKRADREATEGCVLAGVTGDKKFGAVVVLNCETDFVAKNEDFVKFTKGILEAALTSKPENMEALKALSVNGTTIANGINDRLAAIGEKIELSAFDTLQAEQVVAYIHPGNKLACVVGFNQTLSNIQTGKDVAMQVAAMNPVAVCKESVPLSVVEKEKEIAKEQTLNDPRNQGKPEVIVARIAEGKLEKFFK